MHIRRYQSSDLAMVLSAWEAASRVAHAFMTEAQMAEELVSIVDIYLPVADTWVVELDGQVEGFIALIGNEVGGLFVQPRSHGKGLGRALMDQAQALHGNLEVDVFAANARARAFYVRYGFQPLQEKWHASTGQTLWRLRFTGDAAVP